MPEYRAHFDAVVEFVNGGDLRTQGFRLDVPSELVSQGEVSRLFDLLERAFRISTIESEDPSYADQGKPEAKPAPKRSASRETLH